MMKIDGDFLAAHMRYSEHASRKLCEAARALTEEQLRKDLGNSFGGVLSTLQHIFGADRLWLDRLTARLRRSLLDSGEDPSLVDLETQWPEVYLGFQEYLKSADVEAPLVYQNLQGVRCELPVWQVILHVVNHGTYHRGQVTTMLRQLGAPAVSTDLVYYYLDLKRSAHL